MVRGNLENFVDRHPTGAEVALVIEVADVSLRVDRDLKADVYAEAEIPIYWLANVENQIMEIYSGRSFRDRSRLTPNDEIPIILDGQQLGSLALSSIFR